MQRTPFQLCSFLIIRPVCADGSAPTLTLSAAGPQKTLSNWDERLPKTLMDILTWPPEQLHPKPETLKP